MNRYLRVENNSKEYTIALKSSVGVCRSESEYIGLIPNDSESMIFFRTASVPSVGGSEENAGSIFLNPDQRKILNCNQGDQLYVYKYLDDLSDCTTCNIIIDTLIQYKPGGPKYRLNKNDLNTALNDYLMGIPIFTGLKINAKIGKDLFILEFHGFKENAKITSETIVKWFSKESNIAIYEADHGENTFKKYLESGGDGSFFKTDVSNDSINSNIGGFLNTFKLINQKAFNSRLLSKKMKNLLNIDHAKGILLYGPPGTGKSYIAKQLANMINYTDIREVKGPEIFDKFVGGSERNIREIFAPAKTYVNDDDLLLVIIDEADSICQKRTESLGSNVGNSVVNQLLTEISGVEKKNNIFLILTTNRKDMIDEALLRPGRIDIAIEIGLPNEQERQEILQVHANNIKTQLQNIQLDELSKLTINYTGAELQMVIREGTNIAIQRNVDPKTNKPLSDDIFVTQSDLIKAVGNIKPKFGTNSKELEIINQSPFDDCDCANDIKNYLINTNCGLNKLLITGENDSGKTRIVSHVVSSEEIKNKYKFIKYINSWVSHKDYQSGYDELVNLGIESSLLIFDSIEELILFCGINNSYSNIHVQSIYRLLSLILPSHINMTIIIISANSELTDKLRLRSKVNKEINVVHYLK